MSFRNRNIISFAQGERAIFTKVFESSPITVVLSSTGQFPLRRNLMAGCIKQQLSSFV